ncbi:MAG: transglycosylase SLT domain-containing protein [Thermodesulfobacteriota bacterium]|nr:transglycosylase SLT domain-containing protein [Thermodesulfobacteriota bacterium]
MAYLRTYGLIGLLLCAFGCLHVTVPSWAWADIYRYVDSQGTLHFSNVPTSPGYRLYMGEHTRGARQRSLHQYDQHILEAAHRYGVPFSLIKAIIQAESDFDPYAVSDAGACGLMQIMPETARDVGVADAFDPRDNILGGVRYFNELLSRFDGSVPLALAAYNAGPTKVRSLGRMPRIKETKQFVHRVLEYADAY